MAWRRAPVFQCNVSSMQCQRKTGERARVCNETTMHERTNILLDYGNFGNTSCDGGLVECGNAGIPVGRAAIAL